MAISSFLSRSRSSTAIDSTPSATPSTAADECDECDECDGDECDDDGDDDDGALRLWTPLPLLPPSPSSRRRGTTTRPPPPSSFLPTRRRRRGSSRPRTRSRGGPGSVMASLWETRFRDASSARSSGIVVGAVGVVGAGGGGGGGDDDDDDDAGGGIGTSVILPLLSFRFVSFRFFVRDWGCGPGR